MNLYAFNSLIVAQSLFLRIILLFGFFMAKLFLAATKSRRHKEK